MIKQQQGQLIHLELIHLLTKQLRDKKKTFTFKFIPFIRPEPVTNHLTEWTRDEVINL